MQHPLCDTQVMLNRVLYTRTRVYGDDGEISPEDFIAAVQSFLYRCGIETFFLTNEALIGTYLFLSDQRVINILKGLNINGSPRQILSPDPSWVKPNGDVEEEVEKALDGVNGWGEISEIEHSIRERYKQPMIVQQLGPIDQIITHDGVIIVFEQAKINPEICYTNGEQNNAIQCTGVPHGIRNEAIRQMFVDICETDGYPRVFNDTGDKGKRNVTIVFDDHRNALDAFIIHRNRYVRIHDDSEHQLKMWLIKFQDKYSLTSKSADSISGISDLSLSDRRNSSPSTTKELVPPLHRRGSRSRSPRSPHSRSSKSGGSSPSSVTPDSREDYHSYSIGE